MATRPRPFVVDSSHRAFGRSTAQTGQIGSRRAAQRLLRRSPFRTGRDGRAAGRQGMFLFLVSVGMLFGATLIATLVVRFSPTGGHEWIGIKLPWELAVSTLLLAASSATCEAGLRRIRRGDCRGLHRWLTATLAIGLAFLVVQAWCWSSIVWSVDWTRVIDERTVALAAWLVVVLTVVHALHVIGGLAPMAIARRRSAARRYTASQHAGVEQVRAYWHFLGVVWVVLLATLVVALPGRH